MPELPEVETVRRGLDVHVTGWTIRSASAHHPRVARRHAAGPDDLCRRLVGRRIGSAERRGKYLWLPLFEPDDGEDALLAHLGMSGQFRITAERLADHPHLRFDLELTRGSRSHRGRKWLSFLDQRTFGGVAAEALEPDDHGRLVPASVRHVAPDPFEPCYSATSAIAAIRRRHTEIKRALLDQTLVSGIGNIYADEALWRARVHPRRPTDRLRVATVRQVLAAARAVMAEALEAGGTSFDSLYVNVNGESGYFGRSLDAYGREDEGCRRCGSAIRRLSFTNRSSFVCPRCQRPPRAVPGEPAWAGRVTTDRRS